MRVADQQQFELQRLLSVKLEHATEDAHAVLLLARYLCSARHRLRRELRELLLDAAVSHAKRGCIRALR